MRRHRPRVRPSRRLGPALLLGRVRVRRQGKAVQLRDGNDVRRYLEHLQPRSCLRRRVRRHTELGRVQVQLRCLHIEFGLLLQRRQQPVPIVRRADVRRDERGGAEHGPDQLCLRRWHRVCEGRILQRCVPPLRRRKGSLCRVRSNEDIGPVR